MSEPGRTYRRRVAVALRRPIRLPLLRALRPSLLLFCISACSEGAADAPDVTSAHQRQALTVATLQLNDGDTYDLFGSSVAVSGDMAIVGAPFRTLSEEQQGAVYVFVRSGEQWTLDEQVLTAPEASASAGFGNSLAVSGEFAIIGEPWRDVNGIESQGAAHILMRVGSSWEHRQTLFIDEAQAYYGFGSSVAIDGTTAVVGASGVAHVFVYDGLSWTEQGLLSVPEVTRDDGFGVPVAISGDIIAVGAEALRWGTRGRGVVYVFTRNGATWTLEESALTGPDEEYTAFAQSLAVEHDTMLVGARYLGDYAHGGVYVFERAETGWTRQAEALLPPNAEPQASFGASVAMSESVAVIGAPRYNVLGRMNQGAAFVFARRASGFQQVGSGLIAPTVEGSYTLAEAVAISEGTAIVGAIGHEQTRGAAYVFPIEVGSAGSGAGGGGADGGGADGGGALKPATSGGDGGLGTGATTGLKDGGGAGADGTTRDATDDNPVFDRKGCQCRTAVSSRDTFVGALFGIGLVGLAHSRRRQTRRLRPPRLG